MIKNIQGVPKRSDSIDEKLFWDTLYLILIQVAFLFADPLNTAVIEKGLSSRGLSVEKARRLVNSERRMREATQFQAKFLASHH